MLRRSPPARATELAVGVNVCCTSNHGMASNEAAFDELAESDLLLRALITSCRNLSVGVSGGEMGAAESGDSPRAFTHPSLIIELHLSLSAAPRPRRLESQSWQRIELLPVGEDLGWFDLKDTKPGR